MEAEAACSITRLLQRPPRTHARFSQRQSIERAKQVGFLDRKKLLRLSQNRFEHRHDQDFPAIPCPGDLWGRRT